MSLKKVPETKNTKKGMQKQNKNDINNLKKSAASVPGSKKKDDSDLQIRLSALGLIQLTPEQKDLQIQTARVSSILETTIQKLIIAINLPYLLAKNARHLKYYLNEEDVDYVRKACQKYLPASKEPKYTHGSYISHVTNVIDNISKEKSSFQTGTRVSFVRDVDDTADPHMSKVLDILWNNVDLRNILLKCRRQTENPACGDLIRTVEALKEMAQDRFVVTAREEKERDKKVKIAYKNLDAMRQKVEDARNALDIQRNETAKVISSKETKIRSLNAELDSLKNTFQDNITQTVVESEKTMLTKTVLSDMRLEELQEEANAITQQYENLLSLHLKEEKVLKKKRTKVEAQLAGWINKFDNDMTERQRILDDLNEGYEKETNELNVLVEQFEEQEGTYNVLMIEKHEYEEKLFEERLLEYLANRSARLIQRTWRLYKQYKMLKKLEKKKKKGSGAKEKKGKGKKAAIEEPVDAGAELAKMEKKFGGDLFAELKGDEFNREDATVIL